CIKADIGPYVLGTLDDVQQWAFTNRAGGKRNLEERQENLIKLYGANSSSATCLADEYIASVEVPGLTPACIKRFNGELWVQAFKDSTREGDVRFKLPHGTSYEELRARLESELELEVITSPLGPDSKYPWQAYTTKGYLLESLDHMLENDVILIYKGGAFIWPGIEVGHSQVVPDLQGLDSIQMTTLSMQPLVFGMEHFLTEEECNHITARSDPHLAPSPVSKMDHDLDKDDTTWRTSTTYFLRTGSDTVLQAVDQRVADLTRLAIPHQEEVQVLRYQESQKYDAHHDFFNHSFYQSSDSVLRMIDGGRRNRMITVFWYLSDVEEGGETVFPRAGGHTGEVSYTSCKAGLKVKPKRGKVAMFYSLRADGGYDDFSLHGACPVVQGTKYAANKWVSSPPSPFL
ncbi:unnamed protein product, partial [Chrysoparadoxa australica]